MSNIEKAISRFPVPTQEEVADDIRQVWSGAKEHFGFVPNVVKALSHRPAELRAFLAYNSALTEKESGLTVAEKEMIIVAHSAHNGCAYCVASHGAALRLASGDSTISDQIAANYREADITPRQKAMIDFAMKVTDDSKSINEEDFEVLRSHNFSDEDIWDIAGLTAFYNMSNRMMSFLAVRPDDEFYKLGR